MEKNNQTLTICTGKSAELMYVNYTICEYLCKSMSDDGDDDNN